MKGRSLRTLLRPGVREQESPDADDSQESAAIENQIAKPGDPDLDFHVIGLRVAEIVIVDTAQVTEVTVAFDTSEAAGFWISDTGEQVFPDTVSSVDITGGVGMRADSQRFLDDMLCRLEAWRADKSLVAVTAAPGKWTLLYCPEHPCGEFVLIPRS